LFTPLTGEKGGRYRGLAGVGKRKYEGSKERKSR
jgi:hypothetical protein